MYTKVTPAVMNKLADRIAGAVVDLAYSKKEDSWITCDVSIDKQFCFVSLESEVELMDHEIEEIVRVLCEDQIMPVHITRIHAIKDYDVLKTRCYATRWYRSLPLSPVQSSLAGTAEMIYYRNASPAIYASAGDKTLVLVREENDFAKDLFEKLKNEVDICRIPFDDPVYRYKCGLSNRELSSDLGTGIGGGICGKSHTHPDVAVSIYAFLKANAEHRPIEICSSWGSETVDGRLYSEVAAMAKSYIIEVGGFERLAEWGLIR